jgi:hypothetical protein
MYSGARFGWLVVSHLSESLSRMDRGRLGLGRGWLDLLISIKFI